MLRNPLPLIKSPLLRFLPLLAALALSGLGLPAQASASHNEAVYFEGSSDLLNHKTRPHAINQLQALGVKGLRIELHWFDVAPGQKSATKPKFDPTNPASYAWGEYDALINEAVRLHWKVLLTLTSPVPRWATSDKKAPYVTSPSDLAFEQFMTAVARHYGSKVSLFSIWNEPNHPAFLRPQFNSHGQPASPRVYRGLYQTGYAGLVAGGIAHPRVLMGETAPFGYDSVKYLLRKEHSKALLHDVAPLAFLRGMLCLNANYQKSGTCGPLQTAGFAHHAYTLPAGPFYRPPERDDVTIGVLSRLTSALDKAARAHAIPAHVPLYLTEFGVETPPNQLAVSFSQQAQFDAIDEHIAWSNPRVAAFSQYLLRDDPAGGPAGASVNGGFIGFQTGLETVKGKRKPLYASWPLPLTVFKSGHGFALWGLVRPATGATKATVLVKLKGAKSYRTLKRVTTNSLGYWSFNSSTRGVAWRVRWVSPSGTKYEGSPIAAY